MMRGAKTSLLWVENINGWNQLAIMRGDHIPMRDYISDKGSGQIEDHRWIINEKNDLTAIWFLKQTLFKDITYWYRSL
jgi:hypothetical protein